VAAVFDAFLSMYEHQVRDLYRIATGGTGVLPVGDIHPDLAERLAKAAATTAQRVLDICIRSLDYLPPVDVNFGDFLRALITADMEFHPDDPRRFRLAFIDAFRARGIVPRDIRALGEDSLRWNRMDFQCWREAISKYVPAAILRSMARVYDSPLELDDDTERSLLDDLYHCQTCTEMQEKLSAAFLGIYHPARLATPNQKRTNKRQLRHRVERLFAQILHLWITKQARARRRSSADFAADKTYIANELGLDLEGMLADKSSPDYAPLEVHAVRPTIRRRVDGRMKVELLVILTQSKMVAVQVDDRPMQFKMRGGCTLLIDPDDLRMSYAVCKRLPTAEDVQGRSSARLERQIKYFRDQLRENRQLALRRFGLNVGMHELGRQRSAIAEPFAVVHRHNHDEAGY
jgi:hypothetical protein